MKIVELKNSRGEVVARVKMFWSNACGWVTIPDYMEKEETQGGGRDNV